MGRKPLISQFENAITQGDAVAVRKLLHRMPQDVQKNALIDVATTGKTQLAGLFMGISPVEDIEFALYRAALNGRTDTARALLPGSKSPRMQLLAFCAALESACEATAELFFTELDPAILWWEAYDNQRWAVMEYLGAHLPLDTLRHLLANLLPITPLPQSRSRVETADLQEALSTELPEAIKRLRL